MISGREVERRFKSSSGSCRNSMVHFWDRGQGHWLTFCSTNWIISLYVIGGFQATVAVIALVLSGYNSANIADGTTELACNLVQCNCHWFDCADKTFWIWPIRLLACFMGLFDGTIVRVIWNSQCFDIDICTRGWFDAVVASTWHYLGHYRVIQIYPSWDIIKRSILWLFMIGIGGRKWSKGNAGSDKATF